MCPQGHPHQLEPILLKHFHMVLKAEAKRKARGKVCKALKNQIVRTHATYARRRIREMILWCLYVSLLRNTFLTLYYVHTPTPYKLLNRPPTPAPHPYPTLIKYLDEQDNTTTRSDVIPSPCQIIWHTSIDPWTIVSIGNLLAKKDHH